MSQRSVAFERLRSLLHYTPQWAKTRAARIAAKGREGGKRLSSGVNQFIAPHAEFERLESRDMLTAISVTNATLVEDNAGKSMMVFTLTLDNPSPAPVSVDVYTTDGTATVGDNDYDPIDIGTPQTVTFAPLVDTMTVSIPITGDMKIEPDELFNLNLQNVSKSATIAVTTVTGTITDDDRPRVSIDDVSITEGDSGTKLLTFTISADRASPTDIHFQFDTADGSAVAGKGNDYIGIHGGPLILPMGATPSTTVTVPIYGDKVFELDESFFANIEILPDSKDIALILDGQGVGTILNNETAPSVSVDDVTMAEGNSGTTNFTFTLTLTPNSDSSAVSTSVTVNTADNSALSPSDYAPIVNQVVTFGPGETTKTVTVTVVGDAGYELVDAFYLDLTNPVNGTISDAQGIGTINNDDAIPTLSIDDKSIVEGSGGTTDVVFTVSLSAASGMTTTVKIDTSDNTTTGGADYTSIVGQVLTFLPGEVTKTVTVSVNNDLLDELDEEYYVNLSSATNATILDNKGLGTITDDDAIPSVSIGKTVTVVETNGATNAVFTLTLSAPSGQAVSVRATTKDDTALSPSDYTALTNQTWTIPAGVASKTFMVPINGDSLFEYDDTFFVTIADPSANVTIALDVDGKTLLDTSTASITNDDTAPLITIADVTQNEGNIPTTNFVFVISINAVSGVPTVIDYHTMSNTATLADNDFAFDNASITIPAGQASVNLQVNVVGDKHYESTETFNVNLTSATNGTIMDPSAVGTITNDDAVPQISVDSASAYEGNVGTTQVIFTLSLNEPSGLPASVIVNTAGITATAGTDYTSIVNQLVTFAPGETTKTVTVFSKSDVLYENGETLSLTLSSPTTATISGTGIGIGTILDDDIAPTLSINNASANEGNTGTTTPSLTITLSAVSSLDASVKVTTTNGTAIAGSDYVAFSNVTYVIPAGQLSVTVPVTINGDTLFEANETFTVDLSSAVDATFLDSQGVFTIINDDIAPTLSISDATVTEGDSGTSLATFTITQSTLTAVDTIVFATSADGTALAGTDYFSTGDVMVTIPAGSLTATMTVVIAGETAEENDETYTVILYGQINATIADGTGLGTITNDDTAPNLSIADVTVTEGNVGPKLMTFVVSLDKASGFAVSVDLDTYFAGDTAIENTDYVAYHNNISFAPGETVKSVDVTINRDGVFEFTEFFSLKLSNAVNAGISDDTAIGTINNNDPRPNVLVSDVTVTEGNSGTKNAVFTITLDAASDESTPVTYSTANGTATAGSDYTAISPTVVTFAPGETTKTVTVTVSGDTTYETNETLFLNVTASTTVALITDGQGLGTITNDDLAPSIGIADAVLTEGNSGTSILTFTLTQNAISEVTSSVEVSTANGTAEVGSDYVGTFNQVVTFNPGETVKTVSITLNGDTLFENNETFFLNLAVPVNATISDNQALGTITNDDTAPTISVDDIDVTEGDTGTTTATFTLTLSTASGAITTVTLNTADVSALGGSDFTALVNQVITFNPGEITKSVNVLITGETAYEANETFQLNLTAPTNATLLDGQGIATIVNNDSAPRISISDVSVTEGNAGPSSANFTLSLNTISGLATSVTISTADVTTIGGTDYVSIVSQVFTVPAGQISITVPVTINGDTQFENDETFVLNLSNAVNGTIADAQGQGTITNDDTAPTLSVGDVTLAEGNSGTTNANFVVSLSSISGLDTSFTVNTVDGTAIAGTDFVGINGQVFTILAGQLNVTVPVAISGELALENNEGFQVVISSPFNATILDDTGDGSITNDDAAPTLSINDVSRAENDSGTSTLTFTVSLNTVSGLATTVLVSTADSSATSPSDYASITNQLVTIPAGQTSAQFVVTIVGDTAFETNETFFANLTSPTNATIADSQGIGTISNDDAAPTISVTDATVTEGNSGTTTLTFNVTLSAASSQTTTVTVNTADSSATAGSDYAAIVSQLVTFNPGETSKPVTVTVNGDTAYENNESFALNLTLPTNATILDAQGIGTIGNDDAAPTVSINDVSIVEGTSGTSNLTFTITLSAASGLGTLVTVNTANSTASAGSDYVAISNQVVSFAAGETTKTVNVTINGDTTIESDEAFFVNLTNPVNATIADSQGIGTITNDEPIPSVSINDFNLFEGNGGTSTMTFSLTLSAISAAPTSVVVTTADVSATGGTDYVSIAGQTFTIPAGQLSTNVNITINGDTTFEGDETFLVNLSSPTNATISDNQGVGTIKNDDTPPPTPTLSVSDATVTEGNAGTSIVNFTITLSAPSGTQTDVTVSTSDGTANAGSDFVAISNQVFSIPAGQTSVTVPVTINGDTTFEPNETFFINLSSPVGATLADSQGQGTIANDDSAPVIPTISISDATITEGNSGTSLMTFTVSLSVASASPTTVTVSTADSSASAGSDYTAISQLVSFAAGETSKTVTVSINGDGAVESNESFTVNLSSPSNGTIADGQGIGTIANDDAFPTISVTDASLTEGNSGATVATFTLSLSAPAAQTTSVNVSTADGTATAGVDYTAISQVVVFNIGESTKTVSVSVNGDTTFEGNETFFLNLTSPSNATLADGQGQATIINDDTAPTLSVNDVTLNEGNSGNSSATFTITLSTPSSQATTVNVSTSDGTASAGTDYVSLSQLVTIPAGQTSAFVTVPVSGDTRFEAAETFFLNLTNASGATIADGQGQGTINNDDTAPTISITDVSVNEGNAGTSNATFSITLNAISGLATSVTVNTADGTATAGNDYAGLVNQIFTVPAGQTSVLVSVPITGDTRLENNETFSVNLSLPTNGTIVDAQGLGTINNDDAIPTLSINDVSILEKNSGTANAVFTITQSAISGLPTTVTVNTANNTATAGSDYTAVTAQVFTIPAGQTSVTVSVPVSGDTTFEASETFFVNLSLPTNATLVDSQGLGTITNDDVAPTLSINDVSVTEGNSGNTTANFTLTLSTVSGVATSVTVNTSNGTATAGSDYTGTVNQVFTIPAGQTTLAVSIPVSGDTTHEANETFNVNLSNPVNATISDALGVATIQNDDSATLSISDVSINEGNSGPTSANFTLTLSAASALITTVTANTANGTATAGSDYTALVNQVITFAPGETTKTLTVILAGDTTFESNETFLVNLSSPANVTIVDSQGLGTIVNDDQLAHTPSITSTSTNEDTQSVSGLVISRNALDGSEVTHFKITGITGGTLFLSTGVDEIHNGDFITFAQGQAGLEFTPALNTNSTFASYGFNVQASLSNTDAGLGGSLAPASITVNAVNDRPTFAAGALPAVNEDHAPVSISNWASATVGGGPDEAGQSTIFGVTGISNPSLFSSAPTIAADGTLTYTPAPNAFGTSTFIAVSIDNGGTANGGLNQSVPQTFTVTVNSVNDAPSFQKGANVVVLKDSGPYSQNAWASAFSAGPANEAGQTLSLALSGFNPALFSVQPTIDLITGRLTFTPALGAAGATTVTITLQDGGGTTNGGTDTFIDTFVISIAAKFGTVNGIKNVTVSTFDVDGTRGTFGLSGPGTGTLVPEGNGLFSVLVEGSTKSTTLNITNDAAGNGKFDLRSITADDATHKVSLAKINAAGTNLHDNLLVTGTVANVVLNDVNDGSVFNIGAPVAAADRVSLTLRNVANLSVTSATAIKAITVNSWDNTDAIADTITAPWVGNVAAAGDFEAGFNLSGIGAASGISLATINAGKIDNSNWNITGKVNSIVAGSIGPDWSAIVSGAISTLTTTGNTSGSIQALSLGTVKIGGDLTNATWKLTQPVAAVKAIGALTVTGGIKLSEIRAAGHIGAVAVNNMSDSILFAGVKDTVSGLPTSAADFNSLTASIASFTIKSLAATPSFARSHVSAGVLTKVSLKVIDNANSGVPFGFSADKIAAYTRGTLTLPANLNAANNNNDPTAGGDFVARTV